jgi:hypothetical protein
MRRLLFVFALFFSLQSWAGVFKCTDASGHIYYQSTTCMDERKSEQINTKTGSSIDLDAQQQQQALKTEQRKLEESNLQAEEQAKIQLLEDRKKMALAESELTQQMVKQNPLQFSAYAIPSYNPDKLSETVKPFATRIVEIEKFRRLAAQKALASGKCQRVEADELNFKSKPELLVFLVSCSSGASFYFNESELEH